MSPTIKEGSVFVVNKLVYNLRDIKRNEIIVLKHDEKYMIKRVVGLPNEHIEYKDNKLFINGKQYTETFLKKGIKTEDYDIKLKNNEYFVLGDNRENSKDGNDFGAITKKDIVGKAWIIVWPLNRIKIY